MTFITKVNTNDICNSQCISTGQCNGIWSVVQYDAIINITSIPLLPLAVPKKPVLLDNKERVKKISSQYAKMYLEIGGNPKLKGRFYWMALGAIAAKQVYCGILALDDLVSQYGARGFDLAKYFGFPSNAEIPSQSEVNYVRKKLLKGNLWLYLDIYPAHAYYRNFNKSFDTCFNQRNANNYINSANAPVKIQLNNMPEAKQALSELKNFVYSNIPTGKEDFLKQGFDNIKKFEQASTPKDKQIYQLESLMKIANHEQKVILQNCFYAPNGVIDPTLKIIFDKQKNLENNYKKTMSFTSVFADVQGGQAVLTNTCHIGKAYSHLGNLTEADLKDFVENMLPNENLYNVEQRMAFITRIARKFHKIMNKHSQIMDKFLQELAKENIGSA